MRSKTGGHGAISEQWLVATDNKVAEQFVPGLVAQQVGT
jgi:hypothetical protein